MTIDFKKHMNRVLSGILAIVLGVGILTGISVQTQAEEAGITITAGDTEVFVSKSDIEKATAITVAETDKWGYSKGTDNYFVGTFYSLDSILTNAGIDTSDSHGITAIASDGFTTGYSEAYITQGIYIYDQAEVTCNGQAVNAAGGFGAAIKGNALSDGTAVPGNKWAKSVTDINVVSDCVMFFKGGVCRHYCAICGEDEATEDVAKVEPTVSKAGSEAGTKYKCGAVKSGCEEIARLEGQIEINDGTDTYVVKESDLANLTAVTVTSDDNWGYGSTVATGKFYSLDSILESVGVDTSAAHGITTVASDGFTNGFDQEALEQGVYIYMMNEVEKNGKAAGEIGTFGTALKGQAAGNKWAKGIVKINVVDDHVMFFKGGVCRHYCAICGEDEATEDVAKVEPTVSKAGSEAGTKYKCGAVKSGCEEIARLEGQIEINDGTDTYVVKESDLANLTAVTVTSDDNWGYGSTVATGKFYSLDSILESVGVDTSAAHGITTVASDGFTNGFDQEALEQGVYIYMMNEVEKNGKAAGEIGTFGTALKGQAAGNKWAKGIVKINVVDDHVMFVKKGACKHYCAICGENENYELENYKESTLTSKGYSGDKYYDCGGIEYGEVTPVLTYPTGISFEEKSVEINIGSDYELDAILDPENSISLVKWTSSDKNVATVNEYGCVTAVGYGKATITAEAVYGDCSATCEIQTRFSDVTADNIGDGKNGTITQGNFDRIYWAADNGIVKGAKDGNGTLIFNLTGETTRAQMAVMLYRVANAKDPKAAAAAVAAGKSKVKFTDIEGVSQGALTGIYWAVGAGIVNGYTESDGTVTFRPNNSISRASAIIMLYRMAGKPAVSAKTTGFSDVDGKIDTAKDTFKAIAWAASTGISMGVSHDDGTKTFEIESNIQRQQMVTFIYRYVNLDK